MTLSAVLNAQCPHTNRVPIHSAQVDEFRDEKETNVPQRVNWFKMEDLMSMGHVASDSECDGQSAFYYDEGDAARRIVIKHFDLNALSSIGSTSTGTSSLDVVLNGYKNQNAVPDIEHYFILLYYNIHKSSIAQLHQLWARLFQIVGPGNGFHGTQRVDIPIFIDFQNGEEPTDVQAVFDMLFCPSFGVDMSTLREVLTKYH